MQPFINLLIIILSDFGTSLVYKLLTELIIC